MPVQLSNSNVVIVAHHFNPTITDQVWLVQYGIVNQDELAGPYVFTDMLVQVPTRNFHLLIVPDRCQLTPSPEVSDQQALIVDRLGRLVGLLPHTPYRAIGLNFNFQFSPANGDIEAFGKTRFFVRESPLHGLFADQGSRFGSYLSKTFHNGRLKLDIKPAKITTADAQYEVMQFAFNFNLELPKEDKVTTLKDFLNRWNEAAKVAHDTVHAACQGFDQ
jgi:hypothetical protein